MAKAAGCVLAATSLVHSPRLPAQAHCDALCQVNTLGWHVIDPGPPLWFESSAGSPRIEVAVAEAGSPRGDPVSWAKRQLAGPIGAFGALGVCRGSFPAGTQKASTLECDVPPGRDGPRHGALFAVATAGGLQVIAAVAPVSVNFNALNSSALMRLAHLERDALTRSGAVRTALATLMGAAYYAAPDAGLGGPAVEGVYHFWIDRGADFVLFKNGEVWRNPGAGLRDIDPVKFKEARWLDAGSWRRQGGGFAITLNGQDAMLMPNGKFQRFEPSPGGSQRLDGSWQWSRSPTSVTESVVTEGAIRLHADGRFEQTGTTSVLNLTRANSPTSTSAAGASKPPVVRGHYRIDGYTLDLTYDDGRKGSALFYWAGELHNDRYGMCIINGAQWLGDRVR